MNHIGKKLRQLIENQFDTINNFSERTNLERGQIYFDIKREDLNTKRLRLYLPALQLSFSDFFQDFESEITVFDNLEVKSVGKNDNEMNSLSDYYEAIIKEKERTIETQKDMIEMLKAQISK